MFAVNSNWEKNVSIPTPTGIHLRNLAFKINQKGTMAKCIRIEKVDITTKIALQNTFPNAP